MQRSPQKAPLAAISARVGELSLYGCYVDIPAPYDAKTPVLLKIFHSAEYFEAKATVIYVKPILSMGLAFREVKPRFLAVLRKWILAAMHNQEKPED